MPCSRVTWQQKAILVFQRQHCFDFVTLSLSVNLICVLKLTLNTRVGAQCHIARQLSTSLEYSVQWQVYLLRFTYLHLTVYYFFLRLLPLNKLLSLQTIITIQFPVKCLPWNWPQYSFSVTRLNLSVTDNRVQFFSFLFGLFYWTFSMCTVGAEKAKLPSNFLLQL